MKSYLIAGPESLLEAAAKEIAQTPVRKIGATGSAPFDGVILSYSPPEGKYVEYWFTACGETGKMCFATLTLPADWDKLMGILADLKKPKLPEYVRFQYRYSARVGKVCDTDPSVANTSICTLFDVRGQKMDVPAAICTAITEQAFIDGGLKELAEAGYVKGAKVEYHNSNEMNSFVIEAVVHQSHTNNGTHSGLSHCEVSRVGFSFSLVGQGYKVPVGKATLIPALPTTSQGIPYTLADGYLSMGKECASATILQVSTLRHLLRQNVTELVTKAGRLTQADLELLTK